MAQDIQVGDQTRFYVTVVDNGSGVNLSTATSKNIRFKKPDGSYLNKTASLQNSGVSGVMFYTAESGILDQAGKWKIQGVVHFEDSKFTSEPASFRVYKNI